MEKNQFFYTRTVVEPAKADVPESIKKYQDSFNICKVVRSLEIPEGKYVVMLDDFYEGDVEDRTKPIVDKAKNQFKGFKTKKDTIHSEIILEAEDAVRFKEKLAV